METVVRAVLILVLSNGDTKKTTRKKMTRKKMMRNENDEKQDV
tara:strand:- start:19 stop:147 length:129 start_codon:yes stop_codon:yes gene_type:complete